MNRKMKTKETDINYLYRLIERYFDATASEGEERELRRLLASTRLESPEIEQARAVLGFYAAGRTPRVRRRLRLPAAAAAAVVVVAGIGAAALFGPWRAGGQANQCVAYVGSTEITDSHRVMAMMQSELAEMSRASESVRADVASELSILIKSSEQ